MGKLFIGIIIGICIGIGGMYVFEHHILQNKNHIVIGKWNPLSNNSLRIPLTFYPNGTGTISINALKMKWTIIDNDIVTIEFIEDGETRLIEFAINRNGNKIIGNLNNYTGFECKYSK